jgi:hypothetical protein
VENERPAFAGIFWHGASRARTGDLLGAISVKAFATSFHASPFASTMPFLGPVLSPLVAIVVHGYLTKN